MRHATIEDYVKYVERRGAMLATLKALRDARAAGRNVGNVTAITAARNGGRILTPSSTPRSK